MTAAIEREIGGLREAIENQTRSIDRLLDRFDEHERRLGVVEQRQARQDGARKTAERAAGRWRTALHGLIGPSLGGLIGAALTHFYGGGTR